MIDREAILLSFYRTPHRRKRSRRCKILALGVLGFGLVMSSVFARPLPMIVYNGSASAPVGFYLLRKVSAIRRGDLVLVKTPESVRFLAAQRDYLPLNVNLVKRIAAQNGDRVCAKNGVVSIDGTIVAKQLEADSKGRKLPRWNGCKRLGEGEFFLLMESVPDSFDSRYFGPVLISSIVGGLTPLWLR